MIQLKVIDNIITEIHCGSKDKSLINIEDSEIVQIGHDIRLFDKNFSRFLTKEELKEKHIEFPRRFMYETDYRYYVREIIYTEPHYHNETEIIPPFENIKPGTIPVFSDNSWKIVKNDFFIPKYKEINYDSGRSARTLNINEFLHFDAYHMNDFPGFRSIPSLLKSKIMVLKISQKVQYIHQEMSILKYNFENRNFNPLYQYKEVLENVVFQMKCVIDMLVQLTTLLVDWKSIEENHTIRIDSLGAVLKAKKSVEYTIIMGNNDIYISDPTSFLPVLNDLFNSIKHCILHSETELRFGIDVPTIMTLYAKSNDFTKTILYHNHNAYHILMGFEDTVLRIIKNMNTYSKMS